MAPTKKKIKKVKEVKTPAVKPHKHRAIANHSPNQQRMFFAMVATLGHDPEEVKERAKGHYKVGCFNDLTSKQLNWLIDRLVQKQFEK
jgi:hypothetical protein